MRKYFVCILLAISLLGLSGCNKKDSQTIDEAKVKENTTLFNLDGTVQSVIVESFDKNYYEKNELKSYIEEEIQKYTKKAGNDSVILDSLDVDNKIASAKLSFKKITDYATFNEVTSEILTKEQALADERISATVYSVDKGETVDVKVALEEKDYTILVLEIPGETIMIEGTIKYYTNGTLTGDSIIKTGTEGVTVIIYE